MMLVPLSCTMSLLFSPFGERAWVGPGIWVSKMSNRYSVLALWSGGREKRDSRNDAKAMKVSHLQSSLLPSAYSSQISALMMTASQPGPRDQRGWLLWQRTSVEIKTIIFYLC
ncbi:hypothetical protein XENOCAPTIV_014295 [Xenoophorus captivus]|uniref:Secreted protein n=1 Tax=Xenoophorus captivus TaxID=1517983 RepID=A0ABV0QX22_9TELE